ncbi:hypothetical protein [Kordia sp.]|uniref:hypothetical protein n=1 Tax=Kordia sp. TaxID=1965332 RepID=UPI003D289FCC
MLKTYILNIVTVLTLFCSCQTEKSYDVKQLDTLLFSNPTTVTYSTMDLNNNGIDELYMLHKQYSINGDNYELSVYELTETPEK